MTEQLSIPNQPWRQSYPDVCQALEVSPTEGLSDSAVKTRQKQFGKNRLRQTEQQSAWTILINQFESLVVLLLVAAAIASYAFGQWVDGTAILGVVLINAALGFFTELKAVRSMEALQEMGKVTTKVRREGQAREISAEELVPGDIVVLDSGDIISADLRLIEAQKLQANESPLTGESVPVSKQVEPLEDEEVPLAERANMLFKGTSLTRGAGEGVVVTTGMETELGAISSLVEEAQGEDTPLEERLDQLGQRLIWVTLGIAALVRLIGLIRGQELFIIIETAIALAVAAIPEGLPIVATIALGRGMHRMAKRNALINHLAAVETLGGTNVICTDKTGTLTENQMTVTTYLLESAQIEVGGEGLEQEGHFTLDGDPLDPQQNEPLRRALEVGVLCSNASLPATEEAETGDVIGDPVEVALLVAGAKAGIRRQDILERIPEAREETFDPEVKMMATFHHQQEEGQYRVAVKGAPEAVLEACHHILSQEGQQQELTAEARQQWQQKNLDMAASGHRLLALAEKTVHSVEADPYQQLTFLGLVSLFDPPREAVREAINACQAAGIKVVMATGDQAVTARSIGQAVGLIDHEEDEAEILQGQELAQVDGLPPEKLDRIVKAPILARVSPEQKLKLIEAHQKSGAIVAMTGDGVNDAPALKKADIGVAMGQRGTQVAKEAADMVLQDDAFSTIVVAIEQGRIIFSNIRKFIVYHLSGNVSQIIAVGAASAFGAPLPLLPLQILFLNVGIDVFPALALGVGPGSPGMMQRAPRDPDEPIMTRGHWYALAGYGFLLATAVLVAFALALLWLGVETKQAVTISFLTLGLAKLWHVFNLREQDSNWLSNEITRNRYVWGALALCIGLLLLAVYLPGLNSILKVVNPGLNGWSLALAVSFIPLVIGQIPKFMAGSSRG